MSRRRRTPAQPLELRINDLSHDGRGVAEHEGKTVFVTGALPGERVMAQPFSRRAAFDQANLLEVLEPSAQRVEPRCAHFGQCGACALQHLDQADQVAMKRAVLMDNLQRIGNVSPARELPPLMAEPWGYRRKARLSVKHVPGKGGVLVGFRERNPRFVADLKRCEILHPAVGQRLTELSELMGSLSIPSRIPQIEVAAGDDQVVLVIRHLEPLNEADLALLREFAQRTGLAIMLQPKGLDSVTPLHPEQPILSYRLPGYDLELVFAALDFIQVNADINRLMIDQALQLMELEPDHRVLDLFCGLGNFTLPLARQVAAVVGVEGEATLVDKARANSQRNGLSNTEFFAADLREPPDPIWSESTYDRLLLDPPRSGAQDCLPWIASLKPAKILYVSCHPGSLARDAGQLVNQYGYQLSAAGVMDMFPQTAHVESMALFERSAA